MDSTDVIQTVDSVAKTYNHSASRFFPFAADRLVGILRPKPGSKILDVATGTGVVAMALAQAVREFSDDKGLWLNVPVLANLLQK